MRKLLKLVQNEIIKLIKKRSTLIMAIVFLVCIVGLTGLFAIDQTSSTDEIWRQNNFVQQLEYQRDNEKEYYESSIVRDSEGGILYADLMAKERYEYVCFLLDHEVAYDDWRYTEGIYEEYNRALFARREGTSDESEETLSAKIALCERFMGEDGWRVFCQAMAEGSYASDRKLDQSDIWFYNYARTKGIDPNSGELYELLSEALRAMKSYQELLAGKEGGVPVSDTLIAKAKDELTLLQYRLDHGVTRDIAKDLRVTSLLNINDINFWSVLSVCRSLIKVVGIICIAIAGSIVASEFSAGTYKFLLMSPAKRWKILVAKFVTVLLFGLASLVALYVLSLVCCMLFFGTSELSLALLTVENGAVVAHSPLMSLLGAYLLSTLEILVMVLLALAISTLVKGNALAISVSVAVFLTGSLAETIMRSLDVDFGRYLVFANLNLPALYAGTEFYAGQTFTFALLNILCHILVFGWTAWDAFTRREM